MKFYDEQKANRSKFEVIAFHDTSVKSIEDLMPKLEALEKNVWGDKKLPFPILMDSSGETLKAWKIQGFPTLYLIDPEGKIAKVQVGAGPDIETFLAQRLKSDVDAPVDDDIEKEARAALAKADELRAAHKYAEALDAYDDIGAKYVGRPTAKIANERARDLREDPEVQAVLTKGGDAGKAKADVKPSEKAQKLLKLARSMRDAKKYDAARRYYQQILDNHADSAEAKTAGEELEKLPK